MSEKRKVLQYDDFGNRMGTFNSIAEAQEKYGCTHISTVCSGKRQHEKGFVWKYADLPEAPRKKGKRELYRYPL